jgi:hypothetical protein
MVQAEQEFTFRATHSKTSPVLAQKYHGPPSRKKPGSARVRE